MNPAQAVRLGLAAAALTAVALTAVAYALYTLLPVGYDFYHWYWPIPRAWLAGETHLYDPASRGFYLLPWAVWILLPFASMDLRWGMASLTLTSLLIIGGVSYVYSGKAGAKRRGLIALLATVCPYSLTVLFVGTLDAWSLLGAYLGYWALQARRPWLLGVALLLLAVRPQNAVLTAPMLVLAMRRWPRQRLAEVALAPAAVMVASFVSFGWDWPLRWWQNVLTQPPLPYLVTSTYAATNLGGVPLPAGGRREPGARGPGHETGLAGRTHPGDP